MTALTGRNEFFANSSMKGVASLTKTRGIHDCVASFWSQCRAFYCQTRISGETGDDMTSSPPALFEFP